MRQDNDSASWVTPGLRPYTPLDIVNNRSRVGVRELPIVFYDPMSFREMFLCSYAGFREIVVALNVRQAINQYFATRS